MQTLSSTTELDKRMPKALNIIKVPASDNPQSLGKKVVMVYVRFGPLYSQPNGGVTLNRSIYNIRVSQQELTVVDGGQGGIQAT